MSTEDQTFSMKLLKKLKNNNQLLEEEEEATLQSLEDEGITITEPDIQKFEEKHKVLETNWY